MPTRPSTWCINGCKLKAVKGTRHCHACLQLAQEAEQRRRRRHDERRGSARDRGYDWQWEKVRNVVLKQEPVCRMCKDALATMVDHILPIRDGGDRLAYSNLQPLCVKCHARKTADDVAQRRHREAIAKR